MTKQQQIVVGVISLLLLAVIIWWGSSREQTGSLTTEPIKIGYIGPLTGGVALWGNIERNTIELAIDEINNAGGIDGRRLEATFENGLCSGKEAVTAAQKLINEDGIRIILPMCAAEILSVAPLAEQHGAILLTSSTHPEATRAGDFVFRVSYSDSDIGTIAAQTITMDHNKIGVMYENTNYPLGITQAFGKAARELGAEVIAEPYDQGAKDLRSQITKLRGQQVDTVLIVADGIDTATIALRQLREAGFSGQLFGNYFGDADEIVAMSEAEGLIFFANPIVEETAAKDDFFSRYRERYGSSPDIEFAAAQRYDTMMILRKGLKAVGDDPQELKKYFNSMPDFTGLLGTYNFDEHGNSTGMVPSVKVIRNRKIGIYDPAN